MSELILLVSEHIFGCPGGRTGGRAAGRPGRVTEKHREGMQLGNMYPEKHQDCIYHRILTF